MPKPYSKEFKEDVLALARKREASLKQIAKDCGMSITCVENWIRADKATGKQSVPDSIAVTEEIRLLKRRNKLLEQENEVLRRAQGYLAKAMLDSPKGGIW